MNQTWVHIFFYPAYKEKRSFAHVFPYILNKQRSGIYVNSDTDSLPYTTAKFKLGVIITKTMFSNRLQWATVYSNGVMYLSVAGVVGTLLALQYFEKKKPHPNPFPKGKDMVYQQTSEYLQ